MLNGEVIWQPSDSSLSKELHTSSYGRETAPTYVGDPACC